MLEVLKNLFTPHSQNNHRPKILHLSSLYIFVGLVVFFQLLLSFIQTTFPGVLGFATSISPEQIIALTNEQRVSAGLGQLNHNQALSNAAMMKGADMFAKNYWAHFAPDGTSPWSFVRSAGYSYLYAGENLARDFMTGGEVVTAWMNSPTHRDNIVSSNYTEIGVAVINGTLDGTETTLVVQFFGKPTVSYIAQAKETVVPAVQAETKQPEIAVEEPVRNSAAPTTIPSPTAIPSTPTPTYTLLAENTVLSPTTVVAKPDEASFWGLSSFDLTKYFSISLIVLLILVLLVDSLFIMRKKIVRIGGKNLVHMAFLVVVLLIIVLTSAGRII